MRDIRFLAPKDRLMTDWIDEAVEKRKLLKNNCSELFQQVAAILFKHDPMRLDYEVNTDEYEPEAGTIIHKIIRVFFLYGCPENDTRGIPAMVL